MALSSLTLKPHPTSPRPAFSLHLQLHSNPVTLTAKPRPTKLKTQLSFHSPSARTRLPSSPKLVRFPALDNHASRHSHVRFARKLTTLLLSKPRHFLPLRILRRCRRYLTLSPNRPLIPMILRYPSLFRLLYTPCHSPSIPFSSLLSVSLTPAALSLAADSSSLRSAIANTLACKLHRLLMLSPYESLLLSKLVHVAPDLGLPVDFRTKLCYLYPDRFTITETSYGRALQLVSHDPSLASPLPSFRSELNDDRIIKRPRRFRHLPLRRGLNLRRSHRDYLLQLRELPNISPYEQCDVAELPAEMAEKRACAIVREILGMTIEKRTLIDHLTHFRKDFGLPNRLRAMLIRHPDMFYVSVKGIRHSVFLVEAYDDKGKLMVQDELLREKERLMELVREGKRMRRERRKGLDLGSDDLVEEQEDEEEELEDGFDDLFDPEIGDDWEEIGQGMDGGEGLGEMEEFWVRKAAEAGLIVSESGIEGLEVW